VRITNKKLIVICLAVVTACGSKEAPQSTVDHQQPVSHAAPYAIGSSTFFIHDSSRPFDSVAGVDSGIRTLITEIWYPVDHDQLEGKWKPYRQANYGDYVFGNRDMHRLMMTKTTFFHLTTDTVRDGVTEEQIDAAIEELFLRERQSYVDAPVAQSVATFPVVVMSHGDAGSRYNMESVCEFLAAHGYVVIAPEHTGNSPYSMTGSDPTLDEHGGDPEFRALMADVLPLLNEHGAYGSEDNYGQSYTPLSSGRDSAQFLVDLDNSLLQRLNDLRATLDELDKMNTDGRFAGRLELDRIGLTGRSFGGATTLMGLSMEQRFTAGVSVVPPGFTDTRSALPPELLIPTGRESVLLGAEGPFPLTTIAKPTLLLSGGEDQLIIGLAANMAKSGGGPEPTADNPHPTVRQAYENADVPVVWGLLADSNHSTFGVSGGYWWPQLKPDTQQRYFEPDSSFTLIAPARAHKMQQEKSLAFFDLTIRQDQSAKQRLMDQSYQSGGLTLEFRNF
jgi:dienelactone hydrolase